MVEALPRATLRNSDAGASMVLKYHITTQRDETIAWESLYALPILLRGRLTILYQVVSLNRGTPTETSKYYNPYYRDPQKRNTPLKSKACFGENNFWRVRAILQLPQQETSDLYKKNFWVVLLGEGFGIIFRVLGLRAAGYDFNHMGCAQNHGPFWLQII